MGAVEQTSTTEIDASEESGRRGLYGRRVFLVIMAVVVVLGLLDLFGVRAGTASATAPDGTRLRVRHASVARAGLSIPFTIEVERSQASTDPILISVTLDYLGLFERASITPEPTGATTSGDVVVWTFAAPPTKTLRVTIDAQVQPGQHWGERGRVGLHTTEGALAAEVRLRTWLFP